MISRVLVVLLVVYAPAKAGDKFSFEERVHSTLPMSEYGLYVHDAWSSGIVVHFRASGVRELWYFPPNGTSGYQLHGGADLQAWLDPIEHGNSNLLDTASASVAEALADLLTRCNDLAAGAPQMSAWAVAPSASSGGKFVAIARWRPDNGTGAVHVATAAKPADLMIGSGLRMDAIGGRLTGVTSDSQHVAVGHRGTVWLCNDQVTWQMPPVYASLRPQMKAASGSPEQPQFSISHLKSQLSKGQPQIVAQVASDAELCNLIALAQHDKPQTPRQDPVLLLLE